MPESWKRALQNYSFPCNLKCYERAHEFPDFFKMNIKGDRESEIQFENHYQENAPHYIEVFYEVVFGELYTFQNARNERTNSIVDYTRKKNIRPRQLWESVQRFIEIPNTVSLRRIRDFIGIKSPNLPVAVTLTALADPDNIPIIDRHVVRWIKNNEIEHNRNRRSRLTRFNSDDPITDNDFQNYRNWNSWCSETSHILSEKTGVFWRVRDVEMAVFTAQQSKGMIQLNPLN